MEGKFFNFLKIKIVLCVRYGANRSGQRPKYLRREIFIHKTERNLEILTFNPFSILHTFKHKRRYPTMSKSKILLVAFSMISLSSSFVPSRIPFVASPPTAHASNLQSTPQDDDMEATMDLLMGREVSLCVNVVYTRLNSPIKLLCLTLKSTHRACTGREKEGGGGGGS